MQIVKPKSDPIEKIFEGFVAEQEEYVRTYRKPVTRFRASEVADCKRKIWYRLAGFRPQPLEPWIKIVGESGNMHHDYFRHLAHHFGIPMEGVSFGEDGEQEEDQALVKRFEFDGRSFNMSSRADAVWDVEIDVPETGLTDKVKAVVEIKTMGQFDHDTYQRAWKKGDQELLEAVLEKHRNYIWQGNATALIRGLDYVHLVLVGRSYCSLGLSDVPPVAPHKWEPLRGRRAGGLVWRVEESDKTNILRKMSVVDKALECGTPPPPDYTDGSSECNKCPFLIYCHAAKKKLPYPVKLS